MAFNVVSNMVIDKTVVIGRDQQDLFARDGLIDELKKALSGDPTSLIPMAMKG